MRNYSLPVLVILSLVFYATWSVTAEVFTQPGNFQNIASSQSILAVLTLGLLLPMICGNIDMSIGPTTGMASIAAAAAFADGLPLLLGVAVGIGAGAVVGAVNAMVVVRLGVDSFIATLGTAALISGLVNWYTKGNSISGIPASVTAFGGGITFGIPNLVYVLAVAAAAVWFTLGHTPFGRSLHAVGSNQASARLVGIRVDRMTSWAFVLAGALAGLAGVLLLARTGAGNPQIGPGFTLSAIAAAFLGATSFTLGRINVLGALTAIFFLAVNITGLQFAGVATWIGDVFTGLSLVLAVICALLLSRSRDPRRRSRGMAASATS